MKYIISTIKFITILGLTTIVLLGCVRKQPEPVARKNKHVTSDGKYIGPGGYAIDLNNLKERDEQFKREACWSTVVEIYTGEERIKQMEKCMNSLD